MKIWRRDSDFLVFITVLVRTFLIDEIDEMIENHRNNWNYKIKLAVIGRVLLERSELRFQILIF